MILTDVFLNFHQMVTSWGEIRLRLALELLRSPAPEVQLRGRTFDVRALCREAADELTVSFFFGGASHHGSCGSASSKLKQPS